MYGFVLNVHSWMRWVVIATCLWSLLRSAMAGQRPWTPADARASRIFIITLDVQFLLGLLLYLVLSPFTRQALSDIGTAMKVSALRFFVVEHLFGMIVALALAHVGAVRIRKASGDARRHRTVLIFFTLALIAIFASIPWPGMPAGRPLFRIY
jgi:uncharacterized membrane protein